MDLSVPYMSCVFAETAFHLADDELTAQELCHRYSHSIVLGGFGLMS